MATRRWERREWHHSPALPRRAVGKVSQAGAMGLLLLIDRWTLGASTVVADRRSVPAAGEHVRGGAEVPRARPFRERIAPADPGAAALALDAAGAGVGFARHGISLSKTIREVEFLASGFLAVPSAMLRLVRIPLDLAGKIVRHPRFIAGYDAASRIRALILQRILASTPRR